MKNDKKNKIIVSLLSLLILLSMFSFPVHTKANFDTNVYNSILIDGESGKILFQKNIDVLLPVASMSKMMSEYLVLEAINNGQITWDQRVPISEHIAAVSHDTRLSNVHLRIDETYTVRELYESVAIYSANGSTMALGELISGSYESFIDLMNETAERIGMGQYGQDFKFVNSTGLPNHYLLGKHPKGTLDDENLMTTRATAILAYRLINDYPEVLETASIPRKVFKEGTEDFIRMENWNFMLPELVYGYKYIDGIKTGSTDAAGWCFTGTAIKNGQRLISVVMNADTRKGRFDETERLMEYGFNNFSSKEVLPAGYQLEGYEFLQVAKGKEREVSISTNSAISIMMKNGEEDLYSFEIVFDETLLDEQGRLLAPVEKGEKVGVLRAVYNGENTNQFILQENAASEEIDVVVNETVERAGWFSLTLRAIGSFFSNIWSSISETVSGWFS